MYQQAILVSFIKREVQLVAGVVLEILDFTTDTIVFKTILLEGVCMRACLHACVRVCVRAGVRAGRRAGVRTFRCAFLQACVPVHVPACICVRIPAGLLARKQSCQWMYTHVPMCHDRYASGQGCRHMYKHVHGQGPKDWRTDGLVVPYCVCFIVACLVSGASSPFSPLIAR